MYPHWDPLDSFQWPAFAMFALIYSSFAFRGQIAFSRPFLDPARCARTPRRMLITHATYLVGLLILYRLFVGFEPLMPRWMHWYWGKGTTPYSALLFLIALVCAMVERKRLFVEVDDEPDGNAA